MDQLNESRPLPLGVTEFHEWVDRILAGAAIENLTEDPEAFKSSAKYVLANMIMQLGPTESHKPDAHFVHGLRKLAANQVADTVRKLHFEETKARLAKQEEEEFRKKQEQKREVKEYLESRHMYAGKEEKENYPGEWSDPTVDELNKI